jgi:hypothetical protein
VGGRGVALPGWLPLGLCVAVGEAGREGEPLGEAV